MVMRIVEMRGGDCWQETALGLIYQNLNSVDIFNRDQTTWDGEAQSNSCDHK